MSTLLKKIYLFWSAMCFVLMYFCTLPLYALAIFFPGERLKSLGYFADRINATLLYFWMGMPIQVVRSRKLGTDRPYVYCANHTSHLDIPLMIASIRQDLIFWGKSELLKVPLFGWSFGNLHVTVARGRAGTFERVIKESEARLAKGYSLAVFPEGTMNRTPPELISFKEGAFHIAIEQQAPIVPVTLVYNWKILPNYTPLLRWMPAKIVLHDPIETQGLSLQDVPALKQQVRDVLHAELQRHFPQMRDAENIPAA